MADVFSTVYPTQMDYFSQGFKQSSDIINTIKDVQNQDLWRQVQKMRYQQELQASPAIADLLKNFSQESQAQPTQQTSTTVAPQQPGQGGITAEGFANLSPIQQMEMMKQRPQYFEKETVQPTPRERYDKMMGAVSNVVARASRDPKMISSPTAMRDLRHFVTLQTDSARNQFAGTMMNQQPYPVQLDPSNPSRFIPLQPGGTQAGTYEPQADGRMVFKPVSATMMGGFELQSARDWVAKHPTHIDPETGLEVKTTLSDYKPGIAGEITHARALAQLSTQEKQIEKNWTPAVIKDAAESYYQGLPLAQIGLPTRDPTGFVKAQVINEAANIAKERGDTEWTRANAAAIRDANKSALAKTDAMVTLVSDNENAAKAELDRVIGKPDPKTGEYKGGLSQKVPRSETLAANYGLSLEGKFEGTGDVLALFDSLKSFSSEYARVIEANTGAAATTVSGRINAEMMIPSLLGQKDLQTVMQSLQQNMEVTLAGRRDQLEVIKENMQSNRLTGAKGIPKKDSKNPLGLTGIDQYLIPEKE